MASQLSRDTQDAVWNRDLHRRLDAHMERGNELMARSNAHMARGNALMARIDAHMARGNQLMAENTRAFHDLRDVLAGQTEALRLLTKEVSRLVKEMKEEMGAQREALFRILDKLT